jgi:hypothetical protein
MEKISRNLVAPCGMNCGVCIGHLREKNPCSGCRKIEATGKKTLVLCRIRICVERKGIFCFNCVTFPCNRLKHLDKRYRTRYGMSEIENLEFIRDEGINEFIKSERKKWQSSKGTLCVHDKQYYR